MFLCGRVWEGGFIPWSEKEDMLDIPLVVIYQEKQNRA